RTGPLRALRSAAASAGTSGWTSGPGRRRIAGPHPGRNRRGILAVLVRTRFDPMPSSAPDRDDQGAPGTVHACAATWEAYRSAAAATVRFPHAAIRSGRIQPAEVSHPRRPEVNASPAPIVSTTSTGTAGIVVTCLRWK